MTNLTKRRKRSWIISILILVLSTIGSAHVYGQNVIWSSGYPSVNPSPVTIYDTSYVEVKFQVDAAVSGTRITITPPSGVTRVAKKLEALPGNNVTLPTTTTATYTLGNLTTSSVVAFRVPIITTNCAIADGLILTIKLDKGTTATVFETIELPLVFQKPALNVGIPTSLQEYTAQGQTKTYAINLNASTGVLNSWKLTFSFPSGYQSKNTVGLKNFKLNGYAIPANKVTKARVGSPYADSVYTVIFDNTYLPQALAAYGGKLTTTPVTFTVDAEALTPCGTKAVSVNGWFPSTANAATATPNVAPTSACADIGAVQQFIMQMPELGGQPIFQNAGSIARVDGDRKTITIPEICYSDGSGEPSYYFAPAFKNTGSADGYITDQIINGYYSSGYNLATSFIDTSKVFYKIGKHGTEKKIDSETMTINYTLSSSPIYRDVLPAFAGKPIYITFPVPEKVAPGDTIFYYAGIHEGTYYDPVTATETQVSYYMSYMQGITPISVDACGNAGARQGSSPTSYCSAPAIVGAPPVLSVVKGQKKTVLIEGMYTGSVMDPTSSATGTNANRRVYSVDVFVKMPGWIKLDPAALAANTAIQWVTADDDTDVWPLAASAPAITNHGNNTYSIRLLSSDNTDYKFNGGVLKVQYQAVDDCTIAQTDNIAYWINFNSYEEGTSSTACRFSFEHLGQAYQTVSVVCERVGFAMDEFYLQRTTKGYEDLNNDNIPDNTNLAADAVVNSYRYLTVQDTGYVAWKGTVMGTSGDTYKYLYAMLTTGESLNITSTGSNNHMVPFSAQASMKVNGIEQPASNFKYVRINNNQCYIVYEGELKGTDEVEIQLPFYFRAGWTSSPPAAPRITGECFVSNSESTDPFNDPQDRKGDDISTTSRVYVRTPSVGIHTGTASAITNNNRRTLPQSAYYNYFAYPGNPKNFPNEARINRTMDDMLLTLTDGFEFMDDSVRIERRWYESDGTTYTSESKYVKASYFNSDTIKLDLSSIFDYTYPNTTPLEDGKWMNPVEYNIFYFYPYFRATKGAPTTGGYMRVELGYTMLNTGVSAITATNLPLPYNSTATTLTSSTTTLSATSSDINIPVLSVGNPNTIGINNVWLYVEGNVKNIKLTQGGTTITGTGYEGRWLKVADNIASGGNALQFAFDATYVGGGGCADQIRISTVTAYDSSWDPSTDPSENAPAGQTGAAINYEMNKDDINHSGAIRRITVTIPKASVGGTVAVVNVDGSVGTNVIAFNKDQQLTAKLNTHGAAGALLNGVMSITVPAGQQYVAGSAKIAYPSDHATPSAVDPDYETYLLSQIGGAVATDRTFDFDFGAAVGDPTAMINGTGTSADQEAALTLLFTPGCDTKLTGIRYEGVLSGESACGETATGTGKKVFSAGQYPNLTTAYAFDVTSTFNGNSVVGPVDNELDIDMTVTKSYGPLENIALTDSVEVKMHKAFNIISASYVGSTGTDVFAMGSNSVNGDIRSIRMSFPTGYVNGLPDKGVNAPVNYNFKLSYDPAAYTILDGDEQTLSTSMISNQVFDAGCDPQYATIGNKDTLMSIVIYDPYPATVCPADTATVTISNSVVNSDYSYDWFTDAAKSENIGSGDVLDYLATASATGTLYTEVIRNANGASLGMVRYQYATYDAVVAGFEVDEVCFGAETTFTDKTKVGTANASNSNVSSWKWYADGEATPFATTQHTGRNFTQEGNHTVKLIVESTNGCVDTVEQTIYVKPRAVVSFTASPTSVCAGEEVTFTNNSTLSDGTATYQYKYGDGLTDDTGVHAYANSNGSPYTVTLVATTNHGCIDSAKTTIIVSPEPIISTTGTTVCQNTTVNLANFVTNPSGYALTYYTELTGGTQVSNNVTPSSDITYYVEARNIVTGCISIARQPIAITVNPLPVITASNTSVCIGANVDLSTLVDNPDGYTLSYYDVPNGGSNASSNITVSTVGNKNYYVQAQNPLTSCISASRALITVTGKAIPTIGVNPANQTKYNGEMSDIITFTGTGTTYSWTNSNSSIGIPASGTSNPIPSYQLLNTTGSDMSATITVKSELNGCESAEVTHVINIKAKIVYTVTPLTQTVCDGAATAPVTFNSTATGVTYEWTCNANIGAGTSGTGNIAAFTATNTTTSPVTATFQVTPKISNVVVGDVTSFTITVNPTPTITTKTIATCEGVSVDLKTAITGLTNATLSEVVFSTSNGGAFDANIIVNPAAYTPTAASTTIYARATNSSTACPSAVVSFTVTRNDLPAFTTTNKVTCSGGTVDLSTAIDNLTNAVIGNVQFSTTGGASFDAGLIANPATYSTLTSTTIYARATNSNGCVSAIGSFLVSINPLPTFNTQGIAVCSGNTINLQTAVLNLQNAAVGELEFNTAANFAAGTMITTPAAYAATATGTIYVRAVNAGSTCTSAVGSFTLTVNPTPTITLKTIATCEGISIDLKTAVTALTNAVIGDVQFSTNPLATFDAGIIVNPAAYLSTAASTTLYARATNPSSACPSDVVSFTVTRNNLPTFTTANRTICSGGTVDLTTAIENLADATIAQVQFSTATGSGFDGGLIANPTTYSSLTAVTIYARATNSNGCVSTIGSFQVLTDALPSFNTQAIAVCSGNTINLQTAVLNLQNATVSELQFNTASDFGAGTAISTPATYSPAATATIYVRAANAGTNCASAAGSFTLTVNPTPTVTLKTIATCEGTSIDLRTAIAGVTNATAADVQFSTVDGAAFDTNVIVNPAAYMPTAATTTLYARATNATSSCPSAIVSFTVTRNPLPTFTTVNKTICSGGIVDLTTAIENLADATTAQVQFSTTSGASFDAGLIANPTTYSTLSTVTLYARATNANGCVSTVGSFQVNVNPLPTFNTQGIAVCSGNTINLQTAVLNLQNASVGELEFNTAANFAAGTMISSPTAYAPSATATIYVRATNATTTCVSTIGSFTLTVNPTPTVTLKTIATCEGTSIDLRTAITGVTNATAADVQFSTADGAAFDTNVIIAPAAYMPTAATTTLYARATNAISSCPSAIVSFTVTRNPLPTFTTVNKTICSGGTVDLTTAIENLADATTAQVQFSTTSGASFDAGLIANPTTYSTLSAITLYARATNANGCVSTVGSFQVNVNPLPTFNTQAIAVCSGNTINLQTAVLNLQNASVGELEFNTAANFAAGTMISSPTAYAPSATATIYVRATNATTTCVSTISSFVLTVNQTPTIALQTIATCEGTTVDLKTAVTGLTNASINDVQFSVNPAASFDAGIIVNPAAYLPTTASTTLYARATNATSSCPSDVVSFTVTRNPLPTFTTVNKTICYGNPVDLTTAIAGLNNATIAQVQFSTTSGTSFDAGLIADPSNYTSLTTTTIYARATNANACVSLIASFVLTVNPLPSFTVQDIATCAGTSVNLQNAVGNLLNASVGELQFNTAADFGAGTAISTPTAYTPVVSGIIYVKAINAATTCEGSAESFMLTVKPVPTVQAIANQTLCNGETGEIFIDGTGNSYTATSSNMSVVVTSFQTNDAKHLKLVATNNTTAPVTVTITVTPVADDCPGTAVTFDVTVNPTPVVNVVADQVKCSGTNTDAVTFSGNVTGGTYRWESVYKNIGLTGGVGNFPAQAVTNTTNATLQDEIIVTPMYGTCEGTPVSFYVQVNPVPTVYTVQDEVYCAGDISNVIQLTGNTAGATYTWTFSNPAIKLGLSSATSAVIDPFLTLTAGTSDINVVPTYTNYGLTCTGASVKVATITVNPKPTVDFTTTVTGLGAVSFANNSTGATSYTWNFGDGSAEVNTTSTAAQVHTYTVAGTYMVTLTATNGNCSSTISKQIAVSVTTDLEARFNIASLSTQCLSGNSFVFNNTSQVTTAGHTISTYEWNFGDGTTATVANPPAKTYTQAGNYTVTLKVTEAPGGETSIVTKTVTVTGLPVITDGIAPAAVCDGERLQVNMPTVVWNNNSPMNGQWLLAGTLFDPTITSVVASDNGKLLQYQLTTACGTVTSAGTAIVVNSIPVTPSYMDQVYCNGTTVAAISLGSAAGITYKWTQSGDNIGLSTLSGTGSIPGFTAVNNGSSILTATFSVTAFNGTCEGNTVQFSIKVAPEAKVSSDLTVPAICSGSTFVYNIQSLTPGASFVWTRLADADINGGATSTGTTSHIEEVLTNTGANVVTVQYEIKTTSNICTGAHTDILTVDVKPTPAIALDAKLIEVCPGEVVAKLPYTTAQPAMSMTYSIDFGLEAIYQGVVDVADQPLPADTILITLPASLAPGYYNGTISLQAVGGCAGTKDYPFVIQLLEPLKISEQPQAANLCSNDGLELSVTATGKNLTYQWFKDGEAINGAISSVYDVTTADETHYGDYYVVISSACETVMSDIVRVEGNNLMLLTKWDDVIFVSNADRTFTAYQWYKDGKPVAGNGTYQYYTQEGGLDGNYQVKVTYADGGVEMSCPYKVVKTGITNKPTIHIYPNPVQTTKQVTIDMSEFSSEEYTNAIVDLFDLSGKNLAQVVMDQPVQTMIVNAPVGTYVIRITTATGKVRSEKIIVTD